MQIYDFYGYAQLWSRKTGLYVVKAPILLPDSKYFVNLLNQRFLAMPQIIIIAFLIIALVLQLLTGDFPVTFFAFPLNLILAVLWAGAMFWIWKKRKKSLFVIYMLSKQATVLAVSSLLIYCMIIGFTGVRTLVNSWIFVLVMFFFQTVLIFVLFRGLKQFLHHIGLLIAVSSAFWGAPDSETFRLKAVKDTPVQEAFRADGSSEWLKYEITLEDFRTETYDNGVPSMYEADVLIDGEQVTLRVNRPYTRSFGEDIYLTGTGDGNGYCVLQIVREPWKYGVVAGIILMLAGALLLFIEGPGRRKMEDD